MRWQALAAVLMVASPAVAHDGGDEISRWYGSLKQPNGLSCCNLTDCSPVDYRNGPDGYQALVDADWLDVPPEKVLVGERNPVGRGVLCRSSTGVILCFVPASDT